MPVVINGTTGINTPGQTTAGEQIVQRADTNDLLRLSRTGSSAGEGYLYSNANEIFGVKDTGTTYPFLVKRGAPSDSFTLDASGRNIVPNQPMFLLGGANSNNITVNANTALTAWNAVQNIGGHWNNSTSRFTAPVTGRYFFYCSIDARQVGGSTGGAIGGFTVNGGFVNGGSDAIVGTSTVSITNQPSGLAQTLIIQLSANDFVQIVNRNTQITYYNGHSSACGYLLG